MFPEASETMLHQIYSIHIILNNAKLLTQKASEMKLNNKPINEEKILPYGVQKYAIL